VRKPPRRTSEDGQRVPTRLGIAADSTAAQVGIPGTSHISGVRFHLTDVPGGRAMIDDQIDDLGPMSQGEKMVLAVFAGAAFFWVVPGLLANIGGLGEAMPWLETLDDTVIAITAGLILFLLPGDREGRMVLDWDDAQSGLPWGVLLLFGGGLSLAAPSPTRASTSGSASRSKASARSRSSCSSPPSWRS
jgi:hypothetical protein